MYDEKVSYRVGINWKDIILKVILLILFVLLLIWLFPSPQLDTFYDSVYNNNIQTMKDAATDYYTVDRLPANIGDSTTMTLGEMIKNKLIVPFVDKDNKSCDNNASFVQLTKISDTEYTLKVQLACGEQEDYIISTIGCHDVCQDGVCKPVIEEEKVVEYEYKKSVCDGKENCTCPSGYTLNGSTCTKSGPDKTVNATPEYFTDTTLVTNAEVNIGGTYTVYSNPISTLVNTTYSCPSGYTLNGSTCVKTTAATYTPGTTTYSCPAGYIKAGTTCYKTINATVTTGTGSYSCPAGYTLNGTTCYKTYVATYTAGGTTYSCPSGYTLNGSTCYKTYAATYTPGTTTYSCPSGYTKSGSGSSTKCTKTYAATYTAGTTTYSCPSGYTKSGSGSSTKCYKAIDATATVTYGSWYVVQNYYQTSTKSTYTTATEKLVYNGMSYDYTCTNHSQCPVKVAYYSYTLWRRSATTTYSCPSGYTKDGTKCYIYTAPTTSTTNGSYSCPSGGSLSGSTCTLTKTPTTSTTNGSYSCPSGGSLSGSTCTLTKTPTTSTGTGSYSCPNGGSLSGSTCTLTTGATYTGGELTYSCPAGYTRIGTTCTIYTTATVITLDGSYSCPSDYSLSGATCYKYASATANNIYEYSCSNGYTKNGSGSSITCSKVVTGSNSYFCKNAADKLVGDKCQSTVKGSIKGYSCPSGYIQSGQVCIKHTTEKINATCTTSNSTHDIYKWSTASSLEGWTATGKTRTVEAEETTGSIK